MKRHLYIDLDMVVITEVFKELRFFLITRTTNFHKYCDSNKSQNLTANNLYYDRLYVGWKVTRQ